MSRRRPPSTGIAASAGGGGTTEEATVFIVDDDEAVRDSLTILLETAGLPVAAFASGTDFLAGYDRGQPGCLVLDLDLPDLSGPEVLRRLVQDRATVPAILITGRRSGALRSQAEASGAVALLEKPFSEQALLTAIRDALANRTPDA